MNNILPLERLVTASRESRLVKRQEKHIQKLLQGIEPHYKISILGKTGHDDQLFYKSLSKIGSKDLFIKEFVATLFHDSADLARHSLLGISIDVSEKSTLSAILESRECH